MTSREVLLFTGSVLFFACSRAEPEVMITVDMAAEHDGGRFDPAAGDRSRKRPSLSVWEWQDSSCSGSLIPGGVTVWC